MDSPVERESSQKPWPHLFMNFYEALCNKVILRYQIRPSWSGGGERLLNPKPLKEELFNEAKCNDDFLRV